MFTKLPSVPGAPYQAPEPTWWNEAWATITQEQRLADCVNDGALAAFAEWLESDGSGSFELCIEADGYPQTALQLAQTPMPNATVVTSITTSMPPPIASPNLPTTSLPSRKAKHIFDDYSEFGPNLTHRSSRNPTPTPSRKRSPGLGTPKPPKPPATVQQGPNAEHTNGTTGDETESSSTPTYPMVARTGVPAPEPDAEPATNGKATKSRDTKRHQQGVAAERKPEIPRPKNHAPEDNFTRQELDIAMTSVAAEYHRLVDTTEWEKTRLGPYSEWSSALKSMMGICFASATQDSIWFRPLDSTDVDDIHIV